jgi:hypothetical protein
VGCRTRGSIQALINVIKVTKLKPEVTPEVLNARDRLYVPVTTTEEGGRACGPANNSFFTATGSSWDVVVGTWYTVGSVLCTINITVEHTLEHLCCVLSLR